MKSMKPRRSLGRLAALVAAALVVASTTAASPVASTPDPSAAVSPAASDAPPFAAPSVAPSASAAPSLSVAPSSSIAPPSAAPSVAPSSSPATSSAAPSGTPTPTPRAVATASPTATASPSASASPAGSGTARPFLSPTLVAPRTTAFTDGHLLDAAVLTGLNHPTTIRFAADGRAFVAEKGGVVKEFDALADTTPTTVIDLSTDTDNYWDRGLLSLAIDPAFPAQPYLYLSLVYDAPPGQTAPRWHDSCPTPPGPTTDGCVVTSELVRVTVDPATNVATGHTVMIRDWCQQFPSHSGGALAFDAAGDLLVTGGDGASFTGPDYGQRGGTLPSPAAPVTPVNPCGDPTTLLSAPGATPNTQISNAEGGQLRSQDIRTTGDPTGLDGTLIRVDPHSATGDGVASNPLPVSAGLNQHRIVAHGFRNPFRMTVRPGTNEIYVGDVGDQTWEEIDRILPPVGLLTPTTMPNYGWPCYEGAPQSGMNSLGIDMCTNLYAQSNAVTAPLYAYSHINTLAPTGACFVPDGNGKMGSSITGLAFYEGASNGSIAYPAKFHGALFYTDYSRNCLGVLLAGANGAPDPTTAQQVASGLAHPVDLLTGPGGDLYYVDMDGGRVMRVSYHTDPVAVATATPSLGLAPFSVHLDGSGSLDPDPLDRIASYHWDLNHNRIFDEPGIDATGITTDWAIATPAVYTVTLKVVTTHGFSATTDVVIDAANDPPVPVVDSIKINGVPTTIVNGTATAGWSVGNKIDFSGSASDTEDGSIPAAKLSWEVVMQHCPAGCHIHVIQDLPGVARGSVIAPDHEYPSHLELRLTATDSVGASTTIKVELMPNTSTLGVATVPAGLPLSVGGATTATPDTETAIRGGAITVGAPSLAMVGGAAYRFGSWSDGHARLHDVLVAADMSLTATYVPDAPDTCATATTSSPAGSWISQRSSGNGDQDWYRFSLTSKRRVIVTLGSLPVNGRLELYASCATLLATSDVAGTHFEQITKVLAAGTYRVHVVANGDAASLVPWRLRFRPLASGQTVLSSRITGTAPGKVSVAGEVMNNSGTTRGTVTVMATFLGPTGTVVARLRAAAFAPRLTDGGITSFRVSGTVGAYASVRFTASSATAPRIPSLRITSLSTVIGVGGTATEKGTVKNTGSTTARSVAVARTWYNADGNVLAVGWGAVSPSTLTAGHSGTFSIARPTMTGYGGSRSQVRGAL